MTKLICYCYGYTDEDIMKDVFDNSGKSTILERIKAEKKAGNCQCEIKNPQGR